MKTSIKRIATAAAAVALFITTNANAQSGDSKATRLGVGLNVGISTNDAYNLVLGGDLRLQQDFASNVSGTLSAGYTNFSVDGEDAGSVGFIPLKAGIKVFPVERVYISGEVGAGFGAKDGVKTSFVWAPGVGIGFNNGLDLGLRYESFSRYDMGQVALRIAYGFNLSK